MPTRPSRRTSPTPATPATSEVNTNGTTVISSRRRKSWPIGSATCVTAQATAGDSLPKAIRAPPPAAAPIVKPIRIRTCRGRRPACATSSVLSSRSEMTSCSSGCIDPPELTRHLSGRLPILNNCDGRRAGVFLDRIHQETLAVRRDHVLLAQDVGGRADVSHEQWNGSFRSKHLMLGVEPNGHCRQTVVQRNVEQLLAVARPAHLCAPAGRNRMLWSGTRKGLYIHLESAGLGRFRGEPAGVGRE